MSHDFKVRFISQLNHACDSEATRYALGHVFVEPLALVQPTQSDCDQFDVPATAVASDGRVMAVAPAVLTFDRTNDNSGFTSALIPAKAVAEAVKKSKVLPIQMNGRAEVNGKVFDLSDGRFPKWRDIVPDYSGREVVQLSIDAEYLLSLAKAIGAEESKITLIFPVSTDERTPNCVLDPIAVTGNCSEAIGVIMPCGDRQTRSKEIAKYHDLRNRYRHTVEVIEAAPVAQPVALIEAAPVVESAPAVEPSAPQFLETEF